tara:strand:+ start:2101 stop:2658 length:558 start_codon:yes stop_codon:yes gene_type:complete
MKHFTFKNIFIRFSLLTLLGFVLLQCSKDDPEPVNEEETITSVTLTISASNESTQNIKWVERGQAPQVTLKANTTYSVEVGFLDESDPTDVEDITEEVIEEADEHFVFYDNGLSGLSIQSASNDIFDSAGLATGIRTTWQTEAEGSQGTVRVILIHEPTSKTGETRTSLGGETDVEVDFSIIINE